MRIHLPRHGAWPPWRPPRTALHAAESTEDFMRRLAPRLGRSADDLSPYIRKLREEWITEPALLLEGHSVQETKDMLREWGFPRGLINVMMKELQSTTAGKQGPSLPQKRSDTTAAPPTAKKSAAPSPPPSTVEGPSDIVLVKQEVMERVKRDHAPQRRSLGQRLKALAERGPLPSPPPSQQYLGTFHLLPVDNRTVAVDQRGGAAQSKRTPQSKADQVPTSETPNRLDLRRTGRQRARAPPVPQLSVPPRAPQNVTSMDLSPPQLSLSMDGLFDFDASRLAADGHGLDDFYDIPLEGEGDDTDVEGGGSGVRLNGTDLGEARELIQNLLEGFISKQGKGTGTAPGADVGDARGEVNADGEKVRVTETKQT
ncbi:unnamed protein product [Vitrella brassicaformis CCMP3155]|uniref:Uncharacterized protein n=1 Tax=Vitrella brassicaformis (strain CCMP3155) TaxID=1169540 RepID=A0A0G4EGK5_VITBC|nr:unnamed protein product [Vitrella brassicaformis CCMP3155]|eukprot:CEL94564.1 unnamed protein product [Vitrella brassicaformis CCMP3155]